MNLGSYKEEHYITSMSLSGTSLNTSFIYLVFFSNGRTPSVIFSQHHLQLSMVSTPLQARLICSTLPLLCSLKYVQFLYEGYQPEMLTVSVATMLFITLLILDLQLSFSL